MPVRTVAIIVHEGVQALDVAGPVDVFAEANAHVAAGDRYETMLVAPHCRPLRASNGMRLIADLSFEAAPDGFSVVLVAGGPDLPDAPPDQHLSTWLIEAAAKAGLYGSICTGAFALGHAGLLDGRTVTTHWQNAPRLAEMFPAAKVEFDRIYLRDGRLVTSAGVTAGIDLSLALVAADHGAKVALAVAKRLVVVAQRQGGQSQFSPLLTSLPDGTSPIARVQAHVLDHIGDQHSIGELARIAGISARSLARLFVEETGATPHAFIERARVDTARALLEGGDLALKVIAHNCGFGSADRMRLVFAKHLGISPAQYREHFRRR
ncbi:MAG TPA: GlxA family transcriptional regulator [Aliidongia sp.]|nr:GlxA family transcriptional regulator [Aliidongia sp.]